jgi:hypothetical protein
MGARSAGSVGGRQGRSSRSRTAIAKSGSWLSALFVGYGGAEDLVIFEMTSLTSACS